MVERHGIPRTVRLTAANRPDGSVLEELIDGIKPIKRPRGRPRTRPDKLHADKAYDSPRYRLALRRRGIKGRIARKGTESSTRLGRHRWVVERTLAWLSKFRRLTVRYERRADIYMVSDSSPLSSVSGLRAHPHGADLAAVWRKGTMFPLPYKLVAHPPAGATLRRCGRG